MSRIGILLLPLLSLSCSRLVGPSISTELGAEDAREVDLPKPADLGKVDLPKPPDLGKVDLPKSPDLGKLDLKKPPDLGEVDLPKPPDLAKLDLPKPADLAKLDLKKPADLAKADLKKPADLGKVDQPCSLQSYSFDAVAHQKPATTVIYDGNGGITLKGSGACSLTATVSGAGNPAFDVNGSGLWKTTGTVQLGQKLRLRITTSNNLGAKTSASLTVGPRSASWNVTTCSGATCMVGAIGASIGCDMPNTRVYRWTCPGSSELIYASDFTLQFSGTGLLSCPAGATCEWEQCGGNGWQTGTLSCP